MTVQAEADQKAKSKAIRDALAARFESGEFTGNGNERILLRLGGDTPFAATIEKVTGFVNGDGHPATAIYWTDPTSGKSWVYGHRQNATGFRWHSRN